MTVLARPLAALALGGGDLPDGRHAERRHRDHPEVHRVASVDGGRCGHLGHRPCAVAARCAGHRQVLGVGAPGRRRAVSGRSTLLIQGTSGTPEEAIRYGWNYAKLLAEGPTPGALVPSPVMTAMETGGLARIEELTRIPSDVQDALITVLSEKTLPVPELRSRGPGGQGLQRDRHRQRSRSRRERAVVSAAAPLQHRGAAVAGRHRGRDPHREQSGRPSSPGPWSCPRCPPPRTRSGGW